MAFPLKQSTLAVCVHRDLQLTCSLFGMLRHHLLFRTKKFIRCTFILYFHFGWELNQQVQRGSGVSFLYNADVMTSGTFWDFRHFNFSFHVPASMFGKVCQLKSMSMFHFHGFPPVSRNCLHAAMQ